MGKRGGEIRGNCFIGSLLLGGRGPEEKKGPEGREGSGQAKKQRQELGPRSSERNGGRKIQVKTFQETLFLS